MPPDNGGYAVAAYIIIPAVYGLYALSLWVRARKISREGAK